MIDAIEPLPRARDVSLDEVMRLAVEYQGSLDFRGTEVHGGKIQGSVEVTLPPHGFAAARRQLGGLRMGETLFIVVQEGDGITFYIYQARWPHENAA